MIEVKGLKVNELPDGWQWVKLGEMCEILDGKRKPINSEERTKRIKGKPKTELYPYYGATGQVGMIDDYLLDGEFVLLGEDGAPFLEPFRNKAYIIQGKVWVNNHAHVLKSKTSNKYLSYYLNQISYREFVTGTTRLKLNQASMKEIPIALPSLPEQEKIVSKIEELFSELDKSIEELKTAQQQLKVYRHSVLKWAFEGKLTNEAKEGKLPEGWKWVKIESLLYDQKRGMSTGPFGTMLKKHEHVLSGTPVLGIENIGEGTFQMPNKIFITREKAEELKNFKVKENDVIISRSGTVGEICIVPENMKNSVISTNLIRVRLNLNVISPKYFVYMFQGGQVRDQVRELCKGSTRAFLNQGILSSLNFPYCDIKEQHLIVQEIESRLSVADKMEEMIVNSLEQAEVLRQSILKKAFEGCLL